MGLCPKCRQNSVFYDPYFNMARCCYQSCGFKEKVSDEKSYFDRFEKGTDDYARKTPTYDLCFALVRQVAVAYRLNGYMKHMHHFCFCWSEGHYMGESATSLKELAEKIKEIDGKSLEFHFHRRDFERWLTQALGETELAEEIFNLRGQNPVGETLRSQLYEIISQRLGEKKKKLPIPL